MEEHELRAATDFAERLARTAGDLLRSRFGEGLTIRRKSSSADMVTEADRESEELITTALRERFPEHSIVGEEGGRSDSAEPQEFTWVLDPLDGTTNFVHGLPIYAVSIALCSGDDPLLGVVYLPSFDILYRAYRGGGAYKNGHRISCSTASRLEESILATGIPYDRAVSRENNLAYITALAPKIQGLRRLGAAALDMCLVADGSYDGYWEIKVKIWDICAGLCIAREAGALAEYCCSEDLIHILASAPELYPVLKAALQQHGPHFQEL
jgi:myo-inositol-1(or 4)-monophosphatase